MKIRTKLTLRYTAITAAIFLLFISVVYWATDRNREKEFFHFLEKEAVTKANLFLEGKADATVMQSIYLNNREFLDEVEVAVYDPSFHLLYHDAAEIDLVKETPDMVRNIVKQGKINFYQDKYQVIGMLYTFKGKQYVLTAAAYDNYGFIKVDNIRLILIVLWIIGIVILSIAGYFFAKGALAPVADIVDEVEKITALNLDSRIPIENEQDEIGELSITFNHMLDRIETSFDSQKMFVSNISHELRTPLAALISEIEITLFRKKNSQDEYRKTLENILNDSQKLVKLSDGLLDLMKASYDSQQISLKEVRLDEVLLDAMQLITKANESYTVNILFEEEIDNDSLITIIGNEYLLRTAFSNLIENNCKFSEDRTSNIRISFFDTKVIIRFSDTGIGLLQEDINKIFTPFYRGSNKGYAQGNGIGMALVHKIITLHHGQIRVNSHVGEGTVFTIELPHI